VTFSKRSAHRTLGGPAVSGKITLLYSHKSGEPLHQKTKIGVQGGLLPDRNGSSEERSLQKKEVTGLPDTHGGKETAFEQESRATRTSPKDNGSPAPISPRSMRKQGTARSEDKWGASHDQRRALSHVKKQTKKAASYPGETSKDSSGESPGLSTRSPRKKKGRDRATSRTNKVGEQRKWSDRREEDLRQREGGGTVLRQ